MKLTARGCYDLPFVSLNRYPVAMLTHFRASSTWYGYRMKTIELMSAGACAVALFFLGACVTSTAFAQDPLVVNAKTIKLRFENDRVRVLEATLPPGVKEQVHSHPAYIVYVLEGGRYRNYASDGKITEGEFKTGDVIYREPLVHAAENIGDKPMHLILVELKSTGK
jgi:quercetin dioxygenase-like cupin family protein